MKKNLLLTAIIGLVAFFSCVPAELKYPLEVTIPKNLPAQASKGTFEITATENWEITGIPDWLSLSETKGRGDQTITVNATANAGTQRQSILTVTSGFNFKRVKITQDGTIVTTLDPATPAPILPHETETTFHIASNAEWNIEPAKHDWITNIEPSSGKGNQNVTVTVTANPNVEDRVSILTITAGDITKGVAITHLGKGTPWITTSTAMPIPRGGGTTSFDIKSNTDWTVVAPPHGWITSIEPSSGSGDQRIVVTAAANPDAERHCIVIVRIGELKKEVGIIQKGK